MKQVINGEYAFEKVKEVEIMVSFRKLSMCTPSKKNKQQQQKQGAPIQLESLQDILNSTQIYKHCQISVTHMIMAELRCF